MTHLAADGVQTTRKLESKLAGCPILKPSSTSPAKTSFSVQALINPRQTQPATTRVAPKQPTSARAQVNSKPFSFGSARGFHSGSVSARLSCPAEPDSPHGTTTSVGPDCLRNTNVPYTTPFRPTREQVLRAREILRYNAFYNVRRQPIPDKDRNPMDEASKPSHRYTTVHMCASKTRNCPGPPLRKQGRGRGSAQSCSLSRLGPHEAQPSSERFGGTRALRRHSTSPILSTRGSSQQERTTSFAGRFAYAQPMRAATSVESQVPTQHVHATSSGDSRAQTQQALATSSVGSQGPGFDAPRRCSTLLRDGEQHRHGIFSTRHEDLNAAENTNMRALAAAVDGLRTTVAHRMAVSAYLLDAAARPHDHAVTGRPPVTNDDDVAPHGGKHGAQRATSSRNDIPLPSRDVSREARLATINGVHDHDTPLSLEPGWITRRAPRCHARSLERPPPHHNPADFTLGLSSHGSCSRGQLRVDRLALKSSTPDTSCNWLGMSVRCNGLTGEKLIDILESKKHLRFLDAQSNQLDAAAPVAIMREFPRLRHLDVSSNHKIGTDGLVQLCRDRSALRLQSLTMANCQLGDEKEGGEALNALLLHPNCRLVKLDLSFNNFGVAFCDLLAQALAQNRTVRSIHLERSLAYSSRTMKHLLNFETPVHFQELNIARNNLSFEALETLVRFLDRTRVDVLNLSRTNLQNAVITKALKKTPVRTLILVGCRMPEWPEHWPFGTEETLLDGVFPLEEPQIAALGAIFRRRDHILSLSQHKYGSLFCQHLTRNIPIPLLQLTLDHSLLRDEGVKELHVLHTINSLSVQYNHLTAAGVEHLMPLLGMQLQYLNLGGNKLRREGAAVLAKHLPERSVDDFTLGVHQTVLTPEGITELWSSIAQRPLDAIDLRRSGLKHPLSKILPLTGHVARVEVDLRDNPALNNENDLCEWAMQMTRVCTDLPLSTIWACRMLEKTPSLALREPRMHMLNRGITQTLSHTSVQINLDDNQLWRAKTASIEALQSLSPRPSPAMYAKQHSKKDNIMTPDKNAPVTSKQWRSSQNLVHSQRVTANTSQHNSTKCKRKASLLGAKTADKTTVCQASANDAAQTATVVDFTKVLAALKSLRRLILRKCQIQDAKTFAQVFGLDSKALCAMQPDLTNGKLSLRGAEYVAYCRRYGIEGLMLDSTFIETFGVAICDPSMTDKHLMRHSGHVPVAPRVREAGTRDCVAHSDVESPITAGDLLALSRVAAKLPNRQTTL